MTMLLPLLVSATLLQTLLPPPCMPQGRALEVPLEPEVWQNTYEAMYVLPFVSDTILRCSIVPPYLEVV